MSCKCDIPIYGLGAARCTIDFNIIRGVVFVDVSKGLDNTYFYPNGMPRLLQMIQSGVAVVSPKLFDVTANKEASTKQTFGDGTSYFVREGIRTFTGTLAKPIPYQIGALNRLRCRKIAVYLLDNNNNILGYVKNTTFTAPSLTNKLLPIPIQNETIDAILQFATDTTVRTGTIEFQFDNLISDNQLRIAETFTSPITLTNADLISNPPISVFEGQTNLPIYNTATSQFTVDLGFHNGSFLTFEPLSSSDFAPSGTIEFIVNNVSSVGSYSVASISGNQVVLNITGVAVAPGDVVRLHRIQLSYPFIHIIQDTQETTAI